jgi:hypothetical protein
VAHVVALAGVELVALFDDGAAFGFGDRGAVDVAQLVGRPSRMQVAMRVTSMVARWQIAESWWRSPAISRWYFAAEWGSTLRA